MPLRARNAVVLAKVEGTAGVDSSPVAGTDAILVENPTIRFNPNIVQTNEVTGSLDGRGAIVGGMTAEIGFDVYMKGAAAPGTSGPEWGKLLLACGWSETKTAAAVGAPTVATAGTASTVTAQTPPSRDPPNAGSAPGSRPVCLAWIPGSSSPASPPVAPSGSTTRCTAPGGRRRT